MIEHSSDEIIDEFIREQVGPVAFWKAKLGFYAAFVFGMLDVAKFAKDAGVTENEVRQYFGGEPEEASEPDNDDETEATTQDAAQILSQQIDMLEADSNNIPDSADRGYARSAPIDSLLLDQMNSVNHQLNILTRMLAIHARNTLKEGEGR